MGLPAVRRLTIVHEPPRRYLRGDQNIEWRLNYNENGLRKNVLEQSSRTSVTSFQVYHLNCYRLAICQYVTWAGQVDLLCPRGSLFLDFYHLKTASYRSRQDPRSRLVKYADCGPYHWRQRIPLDPSSSAYSCTPKYAQAHRRHSNESVHQTVLYVCTCT